MVGLAGLRLLFFILLVQMNLADSESFGLAVSCLKRLVAVASVNAAPPSEDLDHQMVQLQNCWAGERVTRAGHLRVFYT